MKSDAKPATEVYDRGRRGEQLLGCDCFQCFGYCLIDREIVRREAVEQFYQKLTDAANGNGTSYLPDASAEAD